MIEGKAIITVTHENEWVRFSHWQGCSSCVNYQTLFSKDCKNCFCTAMLFTPDQEEPQEEENESETDHKLSIVSHTRLVSNYVFKPS